MKETIQELDLRYVYDSDHELVSISILSGADIEKVTLEIPVLNYEPETFYKIAASIKSVGDRIDDKYDYFEGAIEED